MREPARTRPRLGFQKTRLPVQAEAPPQNRHPRENQLPQKGWASSGLCASSWGISGPALNPAPGLDFEGTRTPGPKTGTHDHTPRSTKRSAPNAALPGPEKGPGAVLCPGLLPPCPSLRPAAVASTAGLAPWVAPQWLASVLGPQQLRKQSYKEHHPAEQRLCAQAFRHSPSQTRWRARRPYLSP